MNRKTALLLALILLLSTLVSCRAEPTSPPIVIVVTPEPPSGQVTVVVTPPPPEQATATITSPPAPEAGIEVLEAVFAHGLGENMEPVNPATDFAPAETVYLSLKIKGRPPAGRVTARFYWRDTLITEADVDLADANSGLLFSIGENTYVGYTLTHEQPFPLSSHYRAELSYDGQPLDSHPFRVVPPPEAIPSQVEQVVLARGADENYNPIEPATAFAFDETVHLVARGDLGLGTWLQADWYVNGQLDEAGTRSLTAEENLQDVGFAFSFLPEGGWPAGEHLAVLTMNDQEVGRYPFTVVSSGGASFLDEPAYPAATAISPANVQQLAEARWIHVGRNTQDLAWSPDGHWLAVTESSYLYLYKAATLSLVSLPQAIEANTLAFSPDGSYLAVSRYTGPSQSAIDLWRTADWTLVRSLEGHANSILDLAFTPDGKLLASGSMGASVRLWDVDNGRLVHELKAVYQGVHPPAVLSLAWTADGQQIVAGLYGGWVQGWRADNGQQVANFQASALAQPNDLLILPDGTLITIHGPSAKLWQPDGTLVVEFQSERGLYAGAASPDGRLLATASQEGVEFWNLDNSRLVHRQATGGIPKFAFSPDGCLLATLEGDDDMLRLWGIAEGVGEALVSGRFVEVWQRLGGAAGRLGQPLDPAVEGTFVEQRFEHGWMHWGWLDREGEPERTVHVVVYSQEEGNHWSGDLWGRFTDYWQEGDAEYACPEAGLPYGPRRGFGLVWCQYVRGSLGAPLEEEAPAQGSYQDFQGGTMLWGAADGGVYVLFNQGDWQFELSE